MSKFFGGCHFALGETDSLRHVLTKELQETRVGGYDHRLLVMGVIVFIHLLNYFDDGGWEI